MLDYFAQIQLWVKLINIYKQVIDFQLSRKTRRPSALAYKSFRRHRNTTHPLGWRSSSVSTVWSQYSNTRWSFRLRRNTSIRFTRFPCLSCCKNTERLRAKQNPHTQTKAEGKQERGCSVRRLGPECLASCSALVGSYQTDGNKAAVLPDNMIPSSPIYELPSTPSATPPTAWLIKPPIITQHLW